MAFSPERKARPVSQVHALKHGEESGLTADGLGNRESILSFVWK